MKGFWLLVTGTGRCGTGYIAKVLTSVGVKCSHEGLFAMNEKMWDGTFWREVIVRQEHAWWEWEAESSWLAGPFLDHNLLKGMTIVHLVRRPEDVVASHQRINNWGNWPKSHEWIYAHCPELRFIEDPIARSAAFVLAWNHMIEPYASIRWRIEDDATGLLDSLNLDYDPGAVFQNTHYNTRPGTGYQFLSGDLPIESWEGLKAMGREYGYEYD